MDSFLRCVATHLCSTVGENIANTKIIFVSRRAQIYFQAAMGDMMPELSLECTTIDKFVGSMSGLVLADRLTLLTKLYNIYNRYLEGETFEKFYSFGELLLSDFDTIDRYVVDAKVLYSDLSDVKDVDIMGDDEAQIAALQFWRSFRQMKAAQYEQHKFVKIWRSLYDIYSAFRADLLSQGIAYQGMIYRDVAQMSLDPAGLERSLDPAGLERSLDYARDDKYVFVGLNALSISEQQILKRLQKANKATFYWDYSYSWIESGAEAAYFIEKNLKHFPQATGFEYQNSTNGDIKLEVIDTPSEILQCKVVTSELMAMDGVDEHTAVILTDENLLEPLLYSIPDNVDKVNISMGYPLRLTLAYQFAAQLVALQRGVVDGKFYHIDVEKLLRHPYIGLVDMAIEIEGSQSFRIEPDALTGELAMVWQITKNRFELGNYVACVMEFVELKVDSEFEKQAIVRMVDAIKGFNGTLAGCGIDISTTLYVKLLMQHINSLSIDFEGFSGEGMQVLGILESRSLDFDNVIILSMSDDNFPSAQPSPSYIPITLRQGFGMPSLAEHSAIWSYYFFRLLQRAKKVTMVYCSAADDRTSGEASRYIYQLQYCSDYQVSTRHFVVDTVKSALQKPIVVDGVRVDRDKRFSASAISRYIDCPLRFYFHDVASIGERDVEDEGLSALDAGNALHKILEVFYKSQKPVGECVEEYFAANLSSKISLNPGSALILRRSVERMVENVIEYDKRAEFKVLATEEPFELKVGDFTLVGIIDRIDMMDDGSLRIVDYKSGADTAKFRGVSALFGDEARYHNHAVLQMLIYCIAVNKKRGGSIRPALYTARKMGDELFNSSLVDDKLVVDLVTDDMLAQTEQGLMELISTIYSAPFTQTSNVKKCTYCPYAPICRR